MPRPLTRRQQLQHRAFLTALARTANVKAAAAAIGISDATLHARRKRHPDFALRWDAALVAAKGRLQRNGGAAAADGSALRAAGGEPTVSLLKNGRLQVRAARRGSLTKACEQAFFSALAVTANVSLSAAAAGASAASFNKRRRRDPGFAREMRMALDEGCRRLEEALLAGFLADSHEDDGWRHNEPPDMPKMTTTQALQLLYLHQEKTRAARDGAFRKRRGELREVTTARMGGEYRRLTLKRAEEVVTESLAQALRHVKPLRDDEPPTMPDLDQVTGWSAADPAKGGHGDAALFGGWRVEHLAPDQRPRRGGRRRRD